MPNEQQQKDAAGLIESFRYVRATLRNCAAMLTTADALLRERDWLPYPISWVTAQRGKDVLADVELWLPGRLIRQFHRPDRDNPDVLTIAAVPDPPITSSTTVPVCLGSWMEKAAEPILIYDVAVAWFWCVEPPPADGSVHLVTQAKLRPGSEVSKGWTGIVSNDVLLTVGRPLLDVTNPDELLKLVIEPLLNGIEDHEKSNS